MLKIGRKASCLISIILSVITFIAVAALTVFMPEIVRLRTPMHETEGIFGSYAFILTVVYLILAAAAVCDAALMSLLVAIRRGEVFSSANVARIRMLSWVCIVASLLFGALAPAYYSSGAVAFVAFFAGLCLRIVKNAFEEAVMLKEDNDFTI